MFPESTGHCRGVRRPGDVSTGRPRPRGDDRRSRPTETGRLGGGTESCRPLDTKKGNLWKSGNSRVEVGESQRRSFSLRSSTFYDSTQKPFIVLSTVRRRGSWGHTVTVRQTESDEGSEEEGKQSPMRGQRKTLSPD